MSRSPTIFPTQAELLRQSRLRLDCARAAGVACGVFLLLWTPFNALRWAGQAPEWLLILQWVYMPLLGIMLCLPWTRLQGHRVWLPALWALTILAAGFAFVLIADTMFLYMLAAESGGRPPPPAFQGALLFLCLMQPPVIYFGKHPELLN